MFDLGRSFVAAAERSPGATAVVDGGLRFAYGEWLDRVLRLAGGLQALGLRKSEGVLPVLQNRWHAASLHWHSGANGTKF